MGHSEDCRIRFAWGCGGGTDRGRRFRRCLRSSGTGGFLLLLIFFTAHGVAAGSPDTTQASPATQPTTPATATQQLLPATTASSAAAGQPTTGVSSPSTVAVPPSPTPPGAAILMPLQPPTAEMPPATATTGAASPTAQLPTVPPTVPPTATHPANTQTPIPTATSQPTGIPTNTPTGTPTNAPTVTPATTPSPEEIAALANVVLLDNPGIGGNMAIARAASRHFGEQARPDGVPWVGWCEMYIGNVMDEAGVPRPRYATALLDAIAGPLYRGRAPAGSVVYFDQRSDPNGHVGIALGDGTMLSALPNGIVRSAYESWPSYLGWRPYGTTAPPGETAVITPLLSPADRDFPRMPAWP